MLDSIIIIKVWAQVSLPTAISGDSSLQKRIYYKH